MDFTRFAYFVQSRNDADDLFMFLQRPLPPSLGVEPDMRYGVTVNIDLLSKQPSGCFGIGGSPGDAIDINLEKSNQITGDRDAGVVSHIGNGRPCDNAETNRPWVFLHRVYHHPEIVTSQPQDGGLGLLVGTGSG